MPTESAFEEEVRAMSEGSVGRVRLGSFPTASQQLLPVALAVFVQSHQDVEIELDEGEPEKLRANTTAVLDESARADLTPHEAAYALAQQRVLEAMHLRRQAPKPATESISVLV
jgi:DNA-binding transcriptional LysR family regulator